MKKYGIIATICAAFLFAGMLCAEDAAAPAAADKPAAEAKKEHKCEACKVLQDKVVLCEKCVVGKKAECKECKVAVKAALCDVCKAEAKKKAEEKKAAEDKKVEEKK